MKKRNLNVLALGHHLDDAINTLFMSLYYEGRMHTFSPLSYLSRKDLWMIRPMIYAEERDVVHVVKSHNVPVVKVHVRQTKIPSGKKWTNGCQACTKRFRPRNTIFSMP